MRKKILAVFLVLLCVTLPLSGCFGRMQEDETFSMPVTDEPDSLDPQIADSNAERLTAVNCYEGLMAVDENGALLPGVAESYTVSEDGLVYTFTLRQDAHWALFSGHKDLLGENYTETFDSTVYAEDFVFGLRRAVDPQTGSPDAYLFSAISGARDIMAGRAAVATLGVEALDSFTVRITLDYTDDNLLYALTAPAAMPCDEEFFVLTNGRYGLEPGLTLCNGPLHVSRWTEETSIRLSRNDDYRGARDVKPASLTLSYVENAQEIPERMASGSYDAAFLTQTQVDALEDTSDLVTQSIDNITLSFLFNQSSGSLANENLRRALVTAFSPDCVSALGEGTVSAEGLVPPYCTIGENTYRAARGAASALAYDESAASAYFEEALLELGVSSVEIEILCAESYAEFARQTVQGWQHALGVKFVATVRAVSDSVLEASIADGNFTVVLYPITADSASTAGFLESFGSDNFFGFTDAAYTALLNTVHENAGSFSNLQAACAAAEDYLLQHAVLLPVCYLQSCFVTSADTSGIYFYSSEDYVYFINALKK
ncbi:MAG TPA: peptide ABC transporter substrate-binding protein [Candidatus Fimenecus stercoravium]|nr:peptide ABC transporter substrate-binding protein [Candidatus Fimenecus stercoravium]